MGSLVRSTGRVLLGVARAFGWLALLSVLALWIAERTGLLRSLVLEGLRAQAGALAADLDCARVRLDWFEPALEIEDLVIGAGGESLLLRQVTARFSFSTERGFELAVLETRGGHVRVAPALINGLKGFARGLGPPPPPPGQPAARLVRGPRIEVRDLEVAWEAQAWGRVPIGRVDVDLEIEGPAGTVLNGRLVPALAPLEGHGGHGGTGSAEAGRGEITLRGRPAGGEAFEVEAWAVDVPVSTGVVPQGTALDTLRANDPRGRLQLALSARFTLDGTSAPAGRLALRLDQGRWRVREGQELHDVALALEAEYAPASAGELTSPAAWTARLDARARWRDVTLAARAVVGPEAGEGRCARLWLAAPEFPLGAELSQLLDLDPPASQRWQAFEPRGHGALQACVEFPADLTSAEPLLERARFALRARLAGAAGLTYHGWPDQPDGSSHQGFPLPIDRVRGEVGYARDPAALRRFRIALFGLAGEHPSGAITGSGVIQAHPADAPPTLPGHGYSELDLHFRSPALAVDEQLETALRGLRGPLPPESTWGPFAPRGGTAAVDVRLVRGVEMAWLATDLELELNQVGLRWKDLDMPLLESVGQLWFRSDGRRQSALAARARARLETAREVELGLRFEIDSTAAHPGPGARPLDELVVISAQVAKLSLVGEDQKRLAARIPEIGVGLALATPRGFVDALFERTRAGAGRPFATRAEVVPSADGPVELQLADFPVPTRDVRGRVLVGLTESPTASTARTRIAPLAGRWGGDVEVAFQASFPERLVTVQGAGIDTASPSLRGTLAHILGEEGGSEADISGLGLEGRVDVGGRIELAENPAGKGRTTFEIQLRENTFRSGAQFRLGGVRGTIVLEDGVLSGERLTARLGSTPIVLSEVSFVTTPEGYRFDTELAAEDVPIDRQHLEPFMDVETLEALLGDLKWKGRLDVERGHVTIAGPRQGESTLVFRGLAQARAMSISLGLPLEIERATAQIEELVLEGGRMRALLSIRDFDGRATGRGLTGASMLVTYVEPRLSIEDLRGRLAGGEVKPLGDSSQRSGTAFSIDLEAPYQFQLALELIGVQMAELLQGLFASNVASTGVLDGRLRLTGDTEHLLAVQGSGALRIRDSYLWSVPVIRSLLNTVRLGDSVTFDSMAANLRVADGSIHMSDIRVRSDAIQLAGEGDLGFDGSLDVELDGQLNEIKNLEWFSKLLSVITDNLVSITISGDLDRPNVDRHILPFLFWSKESFRALPLPGYAPLPPRF